MEMLKRIASITMVLSIITVTGCSSKKTSNAASNGDSYPEEKFDEQSLVLNGDSDSGKAGALRTIYFSYNSANLSSQAKNALDNNAKMLRENKTVEVQIEGHCDERGGIQFNLALGQRRAKTVKNYLTALGVAANRISIVSYGKERPLEFGHQESSWSKNRRANFVVTAK